MFAVVLSSAVMGVDAYIVRVEADLANGLSALNIVGLPDGAVRESRDRVAAAIRNSGLSIPPRRITVNLALADVRKEGAAFDLPIALAILAASDQVWLDGGPEDEAAEMLVLGELLSKVSSQPRSKSSRSTATWRTWRPSRISPRSQSRWTPRTCGL